MKYAIYNSDKILSVITKKHYHYDFFQKNLIWKKPNELPMYSTDYTITPMFFSKKKDIEDFRKWLRKNKSLTHGELLCEINSESFYMFHHSITEDIECFEVDF